MRALVTGAAGFVGRHMTSELLRRGWDVGRCDIVWGWDALDTFRGSTTRYDLVVHAAASSPHRAAIDREPVHMARNMSLDAAMFDWAARTGQGRVLYLSSSAAYPVSLQSSSQARRWLTESDIDVTSPQQPDAVYGWTKLTGERLADAARAAGVPVTVVRPFSGYGEDQSDRFPFGALIGRARRREDPFRIWGDGEQVRDWIHIDDVIAGALAVVDSDTTDAINLATGIGTSMSELAAIACAQVGYKPSFDYLTGMPAGVGRRIGSTTRLYRYHTPTISLHEGVKRALRT